MRVLMVVTETPPIRSGVAEVAHQLSRGLARHGHRVEWVSVADVGRRQFSEIRLTGLARHWPRLRAELESCDAVNLHGPAPTFSDVFLGFWRTLRPSRRPLLIYTHHSQLDIGRAPMLCNLYNLVHDRLTRVADAVVVSSGSYRRIALAAGAKRVAVVPHGVDALADTAGSASRATRFTVAFVGQLRPYKGVDVLLQVAARLPDVQFEIAGAGHHGAHLQKLAERLELRNVSWLGAIDEAEKLALFQRAHVITLPSISRAEAFGIVLVEGMRWGAVPVASQLPGVKDVASRSGLACRPNDVRSLLQAICHLRDHPADWRARSQRSIEVSRQFCWERSAREYHHLLMELAIQGQQSSLLAALRGIRQVLAADRASLMLRRGQELCLLAVSGQGVPRQAFTPMPVHLSLAGQALIRGAPQLINGHSDVHGGFSMNGHSPNGAGSVISGLCLPFDAAVVQGVVTISRCSEPGFDPSEQEWASQRVSQLVGRMVRETHRPAASRSALPAYAG